MPTTSHFMGFLIPAFGDPSPGYVTNMQDALSTLDAHDHSPGNGVPIVSDAININDDLSFNTHNATGLRSARFTDGAVLADVTDTNCVYASGGNLYFNNAAGTAVQITTGSSLYISNGIGGDYASTNAQIAYTDASKSYAFWTPGNTVYAALFGSQLYSKSGTPGLALDDTTASAYAYRVGVDTNKLQISADTAGTRAVNASGHYTSELNALVLQFNAATPSLGIGTTPNNAAFHVRNHTLGTAGAYYAGYFSNTQDQCVVALRGTTGATGRRSAMYQLTDNSSIWNIGMLSTLGASQTGGALADFTISGPGNQESAIVVTAADRRIGIGCPAPRSRLDVLGNAAIGTYANATAAPTNGLIVSGQSAFGTPTPSGSAALTIGAAGLVVGGGGVIVNSGGLRVSGGATLPSGDLTVAAGNMIIAGSGNFVPSVAHSNSVGTSGAPFAGVYADNVYSTGPAAYSFPPQSVTYYTNAMHDRSWRSSMYPGYVHLGPMPDATVIPILLPGQGTITSIEVRFFNGSQPGQPATGFVYFSLVRKLHDDAVLHTGTTVTSLSLSATKTETVATISSSTAPLSMPLEISPKATYYLRVEGSIETTYLSGISTTVLVTGLPSAMRM